MMCRPTGRCNILFHTLRGADSMVQAFLMLVSAQLAGDALAARAGLPLPGMVLGVALLLAVLSARARLLGPERAAPVGLGHTAQGLRDHFGLLFVPAGADIVSHLDLLAREGGAIVAAVVGSTLIGIALSARIAAGWAQRGSAREALQ
jgi:putative effector of murein hydrolase LrgA (UPF0299 family)